jgi:hypothetical protein
VERIFYNVVIDSPEDVKCRKSGQENKLKESFSLENVNGDQEKNPRRDKKKIVKQMFFDFGHVRELLLG